MGLASVSRGQYLDITGEANEDLLPEEAWRAPARPEADALMPPALSSTAPSSSQPAPSGPPAGAPLGAPGPPSAPATQPSLLVPDWDVSVRTRARQWEQAVTRQQRRRLTGKQAAPREIQFFETRPRLSSRLTLPRSASAGTSPRLARGSCWQPSRRAARRSRRSS